MMPLWPQYYSDCGSVVFVADLSSPCTVADATLEFYEMLQHPDLQGKPVALVLNKTDVPQPVTGVEMDIIMRLPELQGEEQGRLTIFEVSALSGQSTIDLLQWMTAGREEDAPNLAQKPSLRVSS
eukprot:evm.model.scf_446EXC.7 EVM.evm.TU.scf_446EXC.7   scf_446EXC:64931-65763(-)